MTSADWVDTDARWVRGNGDIAAQIVNEEWPAQAAREWQGRQDSYRLGEQSLTPARLNLAAHPARGAPGSLLAMGL